MKIHDSKKGYNFYKFLIQTNDQYTYVCRSFEKELVIVTLITDNGGSPAVLLALLDYMNNILQQNIPEVSVLTTTIDRFGE